MQTKNDEKTVETKMGVILIIIVISIPPYATWRYIFGQLETPSGHLE